MTFVLKGASYNDISLLDDSVPSTFKTIDDTKSSALNMWSSDRIWQEIYNTIPISACGAASSIGCINSSWNRLSNLSGFDPFSTSIITSDLQGIKIPRTGRYLFTLYIFEGAKTSNSAFSIEPKTVALGATGAGIRSNLPNAGNKCPIQCCRIMFFNSGAEVDFRYYQSQSCNTFESFTWSIQELL